ncbi:MATE family efflux transporter [Corynebacterium afermentans subsp. lipophilum]|nr:MATE family efflux transporter [Corynebacterium afermentans subsp. lipophilum]WJY59125.1 Multidrug resistance protein MdtK [Corynebacterium afermentans subsp. lipophilum]
MGREILMLALPALGVLAANPLYLLLDTAVVGRLGTAQLAALAAGAAIQSTVTTQLTFLSYGTTARSSRFFGAGQRDKAVAEGVQATWVALGVGTLLALIVGLFAQPLAEALANDYETSVRAAQWMRVSVFAVPLTLAIMAGNGWMRGVQNTKLPFYLTLCGLIPGAILLPILVGRYGLVGSAVSNVIGMGITAALFVVVLVRENARYGGSWAPRWSVIKRQLVLGRDLILRSLSFQVSLLAAAAIAGRIGVVALAAHQLMLQLWNFLTLVLDSLAIAAQTLTGSALGRGGAQQARAVGLKVLKYSMVFAVALSAVFAVFAVPIQTLFTSDPDVVDTLRVPWFLLIGMILVGGAVFALDGVLLGAADAAFLRNLTLFSLLAVALPIILAAGVFGWGLTGIWVGQLAQVATRLIGVVWRFRSMRWAVSGVDGKKEE